jgi:hypothetical protein
VVHKLSSGLQFFHSMSSRSIQRDTGHAIDVDDSASAIGSGASRSRTSHRTTTLIVALVLSLFGTAAAFSQTNKHTFTVHSYLGLCLSSGAVPGVYVSDCTKPPVFGKPRSSVRVCPTCNAVNQTITVEELSTDREVRLWAGSSVIGATADKVLDGMALEWQSPATTPDGMKAQTFALDGDSIIWAASRDLVLKVQEARGANFTPVVLATRQLTDSEFWDFESTDNAVRYPTSGFVTVNDETSFRNALSNATKNSVIVVDSHASILLTQSNNGPSITLPQDEITIRGGRRGFDIPGAELTVCQVPNAANNCHLNQSVFWIDKNYVRITGIRFKGLSLARQPKTDQITGIVAIDSYSPGHTVYIDHNELSGWTGGAIGIQMTQEEGDWWDCSKHQKRSSVNAHVIANYFHNNEMDDEGYGVVLYTGGYAEIIGNMFDQNRHAIAGDGSASAGYTARNNIAMDSPNGQHDFDMHGGDGSNAHLGGIGGGQVSIVRNTFLRVNAWAFVSRGVACDTETFAENAVIHPAKNEAIEWYKTQNSSLAACQLEQHPGPPNMRPSHSPTCGDLVSSSSSSSEQPSWMIFTSRGQFDLPNPTDTLATGDFDGDGHDDLFLATGAGWFYSPAGVREWRFLSNHTEHLNELLFGDFDNDGRTDVVKKIGAQWFISWGGLSDWELLNNLDVSTDDVGQYAVGHFISPQSTDLFHATGHDWLVSAGGKAAFTQINTSTYRIADLRFADFDGDGKSDVFGFEAGYWRISSGGAAPWSPQPLNSSSLTNSVAGLVVGDFDGDGKPDIAQGTHFSSGGRSPWKPLLNDMDVSKAIAPPGHFNGIPNAQIATFQGYRIYITSSIDKVIYVSCCDMK